MGLDYYLCNIAVLKDGEITKDRWILICNEKELQELISNIDQDSFRLMDTKWLGDNFSLNAKYFLDKNEGLETGN